MKFQIGCVAAAVMASFVACAEETPETPLVTTNVWLTAEGGNINDSQNWQGGAMPTSTSVADFSALGSGKTVQNVRFDKPTDDETYAAAGVLFSGTPADDLNWTHDRGTLNAYGTVFGYFPLCVQGGRLYWQSNVSPQNGAVIRKTGDGALMVKNFVVPESKDATLEIAEGRVEPMSFDAFWTTHVRVMDGGSFSLKSDEGNSYVGSFETETADALNLNGKSISLGGSGDGILSAAITGPGKVQSVAGANLAVTNVSSAITYVAREGNLRFDGVEVGMTGLIGFWKFDDAANPGTDSGPLANDLSVSNGIEIVTDETRGKVVRFNGNGAALYGAGVDGSIRSMPSGKKAYSYSYWLKTDKTGGDSYLKGALFFWGELPVVADKIMLNRVAIDNGNVGQLCMGHNGASMCWPKSDKIKNGEWIHVAVTFDGTTMRTFLDGGPAGEMKFTNSNLPAENFSIGRPWSGSTAWFVGWMDDAMMFDRALSADEIRRLANDELNRTIAPSDLPSGTKLSATLNGEIYLAGTQSVSTVGGNSVRGGVRMTRPGQLTLTGDAASPLTEYTADIAGPVDVVKDGADTTVALCGPVSTTGKVRVKAGTLALVREGTDGSGLFAHYDFEDAADLGRDSSDKSRNLSNNGVTQVVDETRGKVAKFTAASKQTLSGAFSTDEMSGNSDYTFSVWAKASSACPDAGSFVSFGVNNSDLRQMQFRYQSMASKTLVLAHWGGALDFTNITAPADPTVWHHYVAVHKGNDYYVYCDGVQKTKRTSSAQLKFPYAKNLYIGSHFASNDARFFDGLIDDVRIYRVGLDADNVKRLYNGLDPILDDQLVEDPASALPKPVLHYAFEDASDLGKDSSATGCDLVTGGSGTLSQGDSILSGKALKFDANTLSYLQSGEKFPSVIPQGDKPFTVSFWVQTTSLDTYNGGQYPTFVSWGDPDNSKIGYMFSYYYNNPWRYRFYVGGNPAARDLDSKKTLLGLKSGSESCRWHHVATTYEKSAGVCTYIDGMKAGELSQTGDFTPRSDAKKFYLGLKPTGLSTRFAGKLDEVKVYDVALSAGQVRLAMRAEMNPGSAVLPKSAEVTVDAGATLETRGGVNEVAALAGAGTVDVGLSSRFAAADYSGFAGKITGKGALRYTGAAMPSGVTVESDVEIATLALKLSDAGSATPLLTTPGKVALAASGSCAIEGWKKASDLDGLEWAIAKGSSVSLPADFSGWTLDPAPTLGYKFLVRGDTLYLKVKAPGLMILIR